MQKPILCIRADGNAKIGLGHIHRTISLAQYLSPYFTIQFYTYNADALVKSLIALKGYALTNLKHPDYADPSEFIDLVPKEAIVVLDGYDFKTEYQRGLKQKANKLVVIDDLNEWEQLADVVINHGFSNSEEVYKISPTTHFFGGLNYAIIKPELLQTENTETKKSSENILVCIGGSDPNNYSEKICNDLLKHTNKTISLLTYPINPKFEALCNLAAQNNSRLKIFHSLNTEEIIDLFFKNDMAILQPSNIALEACALGIHINLIQTAENQKYIFETLVKNNCAQKLNENNIAEQINSITLKDINEQLRNQQKLVDRQSPSRILGLFNTLLLDFRKVNESDVKIIYDWNSDEGTRLNSYNQSVIDYQDHIKWFATKLKDATTCFLIFNYNAIPAGCVRIESRETENIIGITVAPQMRGKKLAASMLELAAHHFFKTNAKKEITAYIKKQNTASLKSFQKAGFVIKDIGLYFSEESYKLIKK